MDYFKAVYTTTKVSKYLNQKEAEDHELKFNTDYKYTEKNQVNLIHLAMFIVERKKATLWSRDLVHEKKIRLWNHTPLIQFIILSSLVRINIKTITRRNLKTS